MNNALANPMGPIDKTAILSKRIDSLMNSGATETLPELPKRHREDAMVVLVVCYRTADHPQSEPGSTRLHCQSCGTEIWVYPAEMTSNEHYVLRCSRCATPGEIEHGFRSLAAVGADIETLRRIRDGLRDL